MEDMALAMFDTAKTSRIRGSALSRLRTQSCI